MSQGAHHGPITPEALSEHMQVEWVVRQQVQTVRSSWLVDIFSSPYERVAEEEYERLIKAHPDRYFELLAVVRAEICRAFTAKPHE